MNCQRYRYVVSDSKRELLESSHLEPAVLVMLLEAFGTADPQTLLMKLIDHKLAEDEQFVVNGVKIEVVYGHERS